MGNSHFKGGAHPLSENTSEKGVRVFASPSVRIEGDAVRQLEDVARMPGMLDVAGMPDLHPGVGGPVGGAFLSQGLVRPHLVGSDIGCGMSLWRLSLAARKADPTRVAERLDGLDDPFDGDISPILDRFAVVPTAHDGALGTVGRGNHFAEVQTVEEVRDAASVAALGLDKGRAVLLVHTGSRGLGESIMDAHARAFGAAPLEEGTPAFAAYMAAHDNAVRWAEANRFLVARRVAERLRCEVEKAIDVCHNNVEAAVADGCACWLHRKGAAPADRGPVVIPGSRGAFSYLVEPTDPAGPEPRAALWSLAHGAGRKIPRSEAKERLSKRFRRGDLVTTALGSRVVCGLDDLLWEEAPQMYKDIDGVVASLEEAGLCRIIAILRPVATFKTSDPRSSKAVRQAERARQEAMRDRKEARRAKEDGKWRF